MSGNNFVCRIEVIEKEEVAAQVVEKEVEKVTVAAREKCHSKRKQELLKELEKEPYGLKYQIDQQSLIVGCSYSTFTLNRHCI